MSKPADAVPKGGRKQSGSEPVWHVLRVLDLDPKRIPSLLPGIRDERLITTYLAAVSREDWKSMEGVRTNYRFLGFNPAEIMAAFMAKAANNPPPADATKTAVRAGDVKYELYPNHCDPEVDLLFFLVVFLERGNNIKKISMKCDPNHAAMLSRKAALYGIQLDPTQNRNLLSSSALTLARLAQAFAPVTAVLIIDHGIDGKLKSKLFAGIPLPRIMQHTIFSSMIITDDEDLRLIGLILNAEMSILLSVPKEKRKKERKAIEDLLEESEQYVDAAINGENVSNEIKYAVLVKSGLIAQENFTSLMVAIVARAREIKREGRRSYLEACKFFSMTNQTRPDESQGSSGQGGLNMEERPQEAKPEGDEQEN